MVELLYEEETYAIRGAVFELYREMGSGFLEAVYQECLGIEFKRRNIPFLIKQELEIIYKEETLEQKYKPEFICFEKIILELKAVKEIAPEHQAQLFNYLKVTGFKLGLLVNFGSYPKVDIDRIVL